MPMSTNFERRLLPKLKEIVDHFGTPFHIYDELGILGAGEQLRTAFGNCPGFQEFFAVKANPNPEILKLMRRSGFGFDCSSIPELTLARGLGAGPEDIMFTSNNTSQAEFQVALAHGGCILNLDDITLIDKVPGEFPELICFRYNPGPRRMGNVIIGNPVEAKYGVTNNQILDAYVQARERGARRFGLHTMVASNERRSSYLTGTVRILLEIAHQIKKTIGIELEFINMGGALVCPTVLGRKQWMFLNWVMLWLIFCTNSAREKVIGRNSLWKMAAGVIPLVGILTEKGISVGTSLAFMMAVTGLSLPEFMILKKVMKVKLIIIFAGIVVIGIIFTGYLFNLVLK